jgi:hypothetical protein
MRIKILFFTDRQDGRPIYPRTLSDNRATKESALPEYAFMIGIIHIERLDHSDW